MKFMVRIKRIKGVRKSSHNLVLKVAKDYYNSKLNTDIVKFIFGEKISLTNEEKSDIFKIKCNLEDKVYVGSL